MNTSDDAIVIGARCAGSPTAMPLARKGHEDRAVVDFFTASGQNLVAAAIRAGVRHHVVLGVVGTERLQDSGYFRAKLAQEQLVKHSGVPYTIVRATQVFEFIQSIASWSGQGEKIVLSPAAIQPISVDEVASVLSNIVVSPPNNGTLEIAGPERFQLADVVWRYLTAMGDPRTVIADPDAPFFGAPLDMPRSYQSPTVPGWDRRDSSIGWSGRHVRLVDLTRAASNQQFGMSQGRESLKSFLRPPGPRSGTASVSPWESGERASSHQSGSRAIVGAAGPLDAQ